MGRHIDEKIRKIQRIAGKTYTVSLPIQLIRQLGWQENQKVVVEYDAENKALVIKDWQG